MKLWEKIFNGALVAVLVGSVSWFIINEYNKFNVSTYDIPKEVIVEPNKIDWSPLIPAVSSITLFFLRYFLIERKTKKKLNKIPLYDHLMFDTIEDIISNDIMHRTFGSEGRTEAIRTMILVQLDTYRESFKSFVQDNQEFDDLHDFRKKLRAAIFKMQDETIKKWRERLLPELLIVKYSDLYKQRIDLLLGDVLAVTLTNTDPLEALNAFFNEARIVFMTGLQDDAIMALRAMNGELNGLTFNGKKL